MEKVTEENPHRLSRREFLKAAGITAAAVGVSQLASSKSQGLENTQGGEPVPPRRWMPSSLPTVGHDATFIPSQSKEPTPTIEENIAAEAKPIVAEANPLVVEEERNPRVAPKESSLDYNLLSPEAFAPYAYFGSEDTPGIEILDYFPQSYKGAPDSLIGLWFQAVGAKINTNPQTNTSLTIEPPIFSGKISFDYLTVPEGTKFSDVQEQEERILPCESNVVVIGKIDGEENFLAVYQEPVNNCYYFAKMGEDVLKGQEDLAVSKNLVVEAFVPEFQRLQEVGTPEERERLYEVKEGDSLASIASHFGLPSWHCVYGKNLNILGKDPRKISPGQKLQIPDRFGEEEFVKEFTLGAETLSRVEEVPKPEKERSFRYFPETQHYAKGPYLAVLDKVGVEILGPPIGEAFPGGEKQCFQNMTVEWKISDPCPNIPGRPTGDGKNSRFFIYPLGWTVYFHQTHPGVLVVGNPPEIGKYELDESLKKFYEERGGMEIFGYAVAEPIELSNGGKYQFLTNCVLSYIPEEKRVVVAPLGKEFHEGMSEEYKNQPAFIPQPLSEISDIETAREYFEIDTKTALEEVKIKGREEEIEARAVALLVFWRNGYQSSLAEKTEHRDDVIFKYYGKGQERSLANVRTILALHEARYELNPVVERALTRMGEGCRLINLIVQGELDSSLFKDNQYPILSEDLHGRFIFGGTPPGEKPSMILGGGLGYKDYPLVWGRFDLYRGFGPHDDEDVLRGLTSGVHELVHSVQPYSNISPSPVDEEAKKHVAEGIIPLENQENLLAHMATRSLTAPAEELFGFNPDIEPRLIHVYRVLKKGGIAAYKEIVRAAATRNAHRLVDFYEQYKEEGDSALSEMLSTLSIPEGTESYPTKDEFRRFEEEFREDYRRYFRGK